MQKEMQSDDQMSVLERVRGGRLASGTYCREASSAELKLSHWG